jgi:hypothetical protein
MAAGIWKILLLAFVSVFGMVSSAHLAEEQQFVSKIGDNVEPMQMKTVMVESRGNQPIEIDKSHE